MPYTHLQERDIEFLRRNAPLEIPPEVGVVIPNDAGDEVGGRDAVSAARREEPALSLDKGSTCGDGGCVSIQTTPHLVLIDEALVNNPGRILDDLVDPLAVSQGLVALMIRHDRLALALMRLDIAADFRWEIWVVGL
ncbi:hypothetical protein BC938DRAFT_483825 [Jimgerdemannia flammicorona]|uniref:Uncharacterized protein n=1 Tax=Jimgerdemannia flammicorona TaxID=994334 RepID=A0A433QB85_9FUNG|nr:hypothetical protein BC938DRAFT_483825 [Jimgerdemannia flammicorona]